MNDTLLSMINLFRVICVVVFIGHWMACLLYALGKSELETHRDGWLTNINLQDAAVTDAYVASLYWAFQTMTTVGYGDIYPITNFEKLFTMWGMLVSCGVFAYVVGSIETIVRRSSSIDSMFKERILHVNQYLTHQNIPKNLRLQVRRYLEQMQDHKKKEKMSNTEVLNMLNRNLRDEVLIEIVGAIMQRQKLISQSFDVRLQSEIIFMLKQRNYNLDDHVFEENDLDDKLLDDDELVNG